MAMVFSLHTGTQSSQPLHLSVFTTISPFTFAIRENLSGSKNLVDGEGYIK